MNKVILSLATTTMLIGCNPSVETERTDVTDVTVGNKFTPYQIAKVCANGKKLYQLDTGELATWNDKWENGAWERLTPEAAQAFCRPVTTTSVYEDKVEDAT